MSIGTGRHTAASIDQPQPGSQRRTFLDVLRLELRETFEINSGVVLRDGCMVLFVVSRDSCTRSVEIGCDMQDDGWWFTWAADDNRTITPVEDTSGTAALIAGELGVCARNGRYTDRS